MSKNVRDDKIPAHFITAIGLDAYSLLKTLSFPDKPISLSYDKLRELLTNHFHITTFETRERAQFNKFVRAPNQKIRDFILQLQIQASKCNFGDQLHTQLRDRLIAGINILKLEKELVQIPSCTFQTAKDLCITYEDVNSDYPAATMSESDVMLSKVDNKSVHRKKSKLPSTCNRMHTESKNIKPCFSCGKLHLRSTCRFRSAKCHKCGKIGHIKSVCRSSNNYATHNSPKLSDKMKSMSLSTFHNTQSHLVRNFTTSSGKSHCFIIDTGSTESIISKKDLLSLCKHAQVDPTTSSITGITGHKLPLIGATNICLKSDSGNFVNIPFLVSEYGPSLLVLKALRLLNVEISLCTELFDESLFRELVFQCSKCVGGMQIQPIHLEIEGDPIFLKRRLIPYGLRDAFKKELDKLVEQGILMPVESSNWATPIVTPLKADGKTPRICGDYRLTLNSRLLQQSCTTLESEDILYKLHGSKYFSKIDLKDAYLQIPLDEVINQMIDGLDGVESYQDDIIVHGPNIELHNERLLKLFRRFCEKNVLVNPSKCHFTLSSVSCLGYTVDSEGFRPDARRLAPLIQAPSPNNMTSLRSWIGTLQFYSRFIANFTQLLSPLFNIVSSKQFKWEQQHEDILRKTLEFLNKQAFLRPFSSKDKSVLTTDASPTGIAAVLEQNGQPVICISRRLSKSEQGYSQTQKEALAVVWAIRRLHKYLFGTKFHIVTDHQALKFIYNPEKSLNRSSAAKVQRWSLELSAYDYTIEHRSAKDIPHADFLSRYSLFENSANDTDCLLVQPLPVDRVRLINDTRKYYGCIINATKRGWNIQCKRRFPDFYKRRDEISVHPEGFLCLNDRIIIPPTLRSAILDDLHSAHLGADKMKSLARLTCWWPEIDADINKRSKSCLHKLSYGKSSWKPWPTSCEVWQRIHADYCGPFLNSYYALIIVDSYSGWPEVIITDSPNAKFTHRALRKIFSRQGIPDVLVTDNGTHFTEKNFNDWLKHIGCRHLYTAPRHPQSNGLAENFVRTLKSAIASMSPKNFDELERCVDNFLLQYRNAEHTSTHESPAKLFKSRILRKHLMSTTSDVH
ncbi:unnamed protein product [Trichobilharzia szidati]|nr:unnamed protein product [Trichobilharzia szidati]